MSVVLVYGRTHIMRIYAWYIKATYIHARIYLDGARFPHLRGARFSDRNLFPHLNGEASLKALDICSASAATSSSRPAMDSASASSPTFRDRFPHLYNNNVRESACLLYCVNKIRFHHFLFHPAPGYTFRCLHWLSLLRAFMSILIQTVCAVVQGVSATVSDEICSLTLIAQYSNVQIPI